MTSQPLRTPRRTRPGGFPLRPVLWSRRALLAASGALSLSACLPAAQAPAPPPDPDLRLRRRVAAQVAQLAGAYAAATSAHPTLTATLQPLAAEHRTHVSALAGPSVAGSPNASPPASASPSPQVPDTPVATLDWLTGLERQAARRRRTQCLRAGPALSRLLASVGACEAAHAALLERATP